MAEITRVFTGDHLEVGDALRFSGEEERHVFKVLRGRAGDRIEVVDGAGRLFVAELAPGAHAREARIVEELPAEIKEVAGIVLYQAVPKGRHMDLVVEKATELGAERIIPLLTERGVVRLSEGDGKTERWRRVAVAAARQSLRLRVPEVGAVVPFARAVREAGENGVLLHNEPGLPPLEDVVPASSVAPGCGRAALFVGPEGGFSGGEVELAREAGLFLASLGPYRLRSETAGVVAVARAHAALEKAAGEAVESGAGNDSGRER